MPNRLAEELSPYLLQHAENPVDWRPWSAETLDEARRQGKPIFLSIGYASCHWCHVMAHESFEDSEIAALLNEHFVSIKVDREERPDLDDLYMDAVQMMARRGGWPMSVFLTPEQEPFLGGTYWPPTARGGMPGFDQVLRAVADAWQNRRDELVDQARRFTDLMQAQARTVGDATTVLDDGPLQAAEVALRQTFDADHGGFGPAPKFPQPILLRFLLYRWRRSNDRDLLQMIATTLDAMAAGGIRDHLGGGFCRYSVDDRWLTPHFEKMLYDNSLLALCYAEAFEATGRDSYADAACTTLDYLCRDMRDSLGGFHGSEDADSEGEEGRYYVWTPNEVAAVLGPAAAATFCRVYDVTEAGNFEGRNILHLARPVEIEARMLGRETQALAADLAESRAKLLAARNARVRPGRDDKVLVAWNSLAIEALARAGAILRKHRYVEVAAAAARFLLDHARGDDGRLRRYWRQGRMKGDGFLDDYAGLANALITLYETDGAAMWLDEARGIADAIRARFGDAEHGGFFYLSSDSEPLLVRKRPILDNPTPSGNGLAASLLLRLASHGGGAVDCAVVDATFRACSPWMRQYPVGTGQLLLALDERRANV
jgi:uncharacterized protein